MHRQPFVRVGMVRSIPPRLRTFWSKPISLFGLFELTALTSI